MLMTTALCYMIINTIYLTNQVFKAYEINAIQSHIIWQQHMLFFVVVMILSEPICLSSFL